MQLTKDSDRAAGGQPWLASRFRLISWLDMLKFSAGDFYYIGRLIARLEGVLGKFNPSAFVNQEGITISKDIIQDMDKNCEKIGLTMSQKAAWRALRRLDTSIKYSELVQTCADLSLRISDEIGDHLFLFVPKTHAAFYESEKLFGDSVENAFPSSSYDLKEAGKCFALNRNTAAICHLMRVLEVGLRAMAVKLKVKYENKPWNYVIEVADNRLKKIRAAKRKPRDWKSNEKFYSEAIAHFRFLKDAWRNYSMHVYERYDEEQAESIFNHTKAFMRQLATKLKETP
jgi:hypothetical protein